MILLIASISVLIIGIIIKVKSNFECSDYVRVLCIVWGLAVFVLVTIAFIVHYHQCNIDILAFEETRLIYERASANGNNIYVAFKVVESNRWLRKQQYWNDTIFDIAIPNEIMKLEVIK